MKVGVVDFGAGNLRSVLNMFSLLGEDAIVVREPDELATADRLVLPGVGAAGEAMQRLRARHLDEALEEAVRRRGRPLLGICLGMQLIAERLFEFGEHRGLGWVAGDVVNIRACVTDAALRVPHMGWNRIDVLPAGESLLSGLGTARDFYFAHSFTLRTHDDNVIAARTNYGADLVTAVRKDTIFATQFHPEKSQRSGEKVLAAFLEWNP
jgi:glutamine amidotransferase